MGDTNCTGQDTTCWNNSNFCLTDGSSGVQAGENCMACGTSNLAIIDAPTKSNTCCLDPSLSNNDPTYKAANDKILSAVTLGDTPVVSYFCSANSCPTGSTDLAVLQTSCGSSFTCSGATDQTTCEGCQYCKWSPVYTSGPNNTLVDSGSKQCVAACPTAPQNGWVGSGVTPTPTSTPTPAPTNSPTIIPTVAPISNLSTTDIVLIVIGIIVILAFFVNVGIVMKPSGSRSFGKRTGLSFGKRIR
jgi:hypothetical protein